jgi:serine/threonine protein kinase
MAADGTVADLDESAKHYELAASLGYVIGLDRAYRCLRGLNKAPFSERHFPALFPRRTLLLSRHESNRPYIAPKMVSSYLAKPHPPADRVLIGTGGFSTVQVETDPKTNQRIAAKQLFSHLTEDMQFIREVETLIKLNHHCIVRILGFNLPPVTDFAEIQMEYAPNGSLKSVLKKVRFGQIPRFWDPTAVGKIICGIVLGMRFVHSQSFIHRDLKPSNILINEQGEAMIADFGTSRSEYDDGTLTGDTGTAHYAAPEMYREDGITNKVDVFSFGLILYEILVGRAVFRSSKAPRRVMNRVLGGEMREIPDRVGNVMKSLIARCWSQKAEDRPSFDDIFKEFQTNNFAVFPGGSSQKIFEYARSVLDWEAGNSKRALMPEPTVVSDVGVVQSDK